MMQTIRTAEPLPASRTRLIWGDGSGSAVDLGVIPDEDEIDLCADALWGTAHGDEAETL